VNEQAALKISSRSGASCDCSVLQAMGNNPIYYYYQQRVDADLVFNYRLWLSAHRPVSAANCRLCRPFPTEPRVFECNIVALSRETNASDWPSSPDPHQPRGRHSSKTTSVTSVTLARQGERHVITTTLCCSVHSTSNMGSMSMVLKISRFSQYIVFVLSKEGPLERPLGAPYRSSETHLRRLGPRFW
jgi:hypothetical protein